MFESRERTLTAVADRSEPGAIQRRMLVAGPVVAVAAMLLALLSTDAAGVSLRDPDGVAGRRFVLVILLVLALVGADLLVRAWKRAGRFPPGLAVLREVRRERWTPWRGVAVGSALLSFYVAYLAYRNLKSVVPLLRPDVLFDVQLGELDRNLFGGNDPATLLHTLLGTGIPTHVLSSVYMIFFLFIPGSLAVALVFSRDLQAGLFYTTAQSLNWVLGAASYYLLPSLGPVYADPIVFAGLPASGVSSLQDLLLDQRMAFLADPSVAGSAQSIGAFSSLHVSIFFTAALAAYLLGINRRVQTGIWVLLGLTTTATVYFGWHYVLDDLGGLVIGGMAIVIARALTGFDLSTARRLSTADPTPA